MNESKINFIIHVKEVIPQMAVDPRLKAVDVFLYMSLFLQWNKANFKNPLQVWRQNIQGVNKVSDDCFSPSLTRLHDAGYIVYKKGKNGIKPAIITMIRFEVVGKISQADTILNFQLYSPTPRNLAILEKGIIIKQEKTETKEEENNLSFNNNNKTFPTQSPAIIKNVPNPHAPDRQEVRRYFLQKGSTAEEADKFYEWNNKRNWTLSKESQDWRWHADNWINNSFKKRKQKKTSKYELNSTTDQEYNEPF